MKLYTIGFTNKSARRFFELLQASKVKRIFDTRISNSSQLSGFAKGNDLQFLVKEIADIDYSHKVEWATTKDLLDEYRKKELSWDEYAQKYLDLLKARRIESSLDVNELDHGCLLCSEHLPEKCHRRLLAEYIVKGGHPEIEV